VWYYRLGSMHVYDHPSNHTSPINLIKTTVEIYTETRRSVSVADVHLDDMPTSLQISTADENEEVVRMSVDSIYSFSLF